MPDKEGMKTLLLAILVTGFGLVGCATGYKAKGYSGGYYDRKMGANKWLVGFSGNGYTSRSTAQEYAFKRAEELCKEKGFSDWDISNQHENTQSSYVPGSCYGNSCNSGFISNKPTIEVVVSCKGDNQRSQASE